MAEIVLRERAFSPAVETLCQVPSLYVVEQGKEGTQLIYSSVSPVDVIHLPLTQFAGSTGPVPFCLAL